MRDQTTTLVLLALAVAGDAGVSDSKLAKELARRPHNVRRTLRKALEAGLVVEGADGRYRTPRTSTGG